MHCWCFNLSWVIYLISEFIGLLLIHSQLYCREWLTKVPLNQLRSKMLFTSQFYRLSTRCTVAHHLILDVMDFSSGDCSKSSDSTWSNMKTYASICFFKKKKKKCFQVDWAILAVHKDKRFLFCRTLGNFGQSLQSESARFLFPFKNVDTQSAWHR